MNCVLHTRARRWALLIGLSLTVLLPPPMAAQTIDEYAVRTAFVYNLTKYVQWPQENSELIVGFVGEDAMGETLKKVLEGRISDGKILHVLLSPAESDLEKCQILYFGFMAPKKARELTEKLKNKSVLTVGDADWFLSSGGMVELARAGERIQIRINVNAVQTGKLKISSHLLDLATLVHSNAAGRN